MARRLVTRARPPEAQRGRFCHVRIALQLPTGLHSHAPGSRSVRSALGKCGARNDLAVWAQRRPRVKSRQQYLPRCGSQQQQHDRKLGMEGHPAPRISAAPAAPSQKTRQRLLGLAIWASRCPLPRRALRVCAARQQGDIMRETSSATALRSPRPQPGASGAYAAAGAVGSCAAQQGAHMTGQTGPKQPLTEALLRSRHHLVLL